MSPGRAEDQDLAQAVGTSPRADAGELRLQLPAIGGEEPGGDAGHLCLDSGARDGADPGAARGGQDPSGGGLGVKAIENGFSVAFFQLGDLLFVMKRAADLAPRALRRKKYLNVALLIIDEMGFQALDRQEASLLFRLVNYRYGRGSILITTNKSVKDWPENPAGDDVMATALLDRLLHRCHVLSIKGRSWQLRDLEARLR